MVPPDDAPGYHLRPIARGVLGEASKVIEEAEEFADAVAQGVTVMALIELADLYGAMEAYLRQFNLQMDDLRKMSEVNRRAFENGHRTAR